METGDVSNNVIQDDDIIELNLGGCKSIATKRSTLCLAEGSMFSSMFSGRWNDRLELDKGK